MSRTRKMLRDRFCKARDDEDLHAVFMSCAEGYRMDVVSRGFFIEMGRRALLGMTCIYFARLDYDTFVHILDSTGAGIDDIEDIGCFLHFR